MYRSGLGDIPQEVESILERLGKIENTLLQDQRACNTGRNIIKNAFFDTGLGQSVNVIPEGIPGDTCYPSLIVAIGSSSYEYIDGRLLEAGNHVTVICPNTQYVIFWAVQWNVASWIKRASSFKKVTVILKLFGASPIIL